jgi:hypothetical protein
MCRKLPNAMGLGLKAVAFGGTMHTPAVGHFSQAGAMVAGRRRPEARMLPPAAMMVIRTATAAAATAFKTQYKAGMIGITITPTRRFSRDPLHGCNRSHQQHSAF